MVRNAGGVICFSFQQSFALEVELGLALPLIHQPAHASKKSSALTEVPSSGLF